MITKKELLKHAKKSNVILSCEKHSKDTYFSIKKLEKSRWGRSRVYVWFKDKLRGDEKMWCRIIKGDRKQGIGALDNQPHNQIQFNVGDKFRFQTDSEGITWKVRKV